MVRRVRLFAGRSPPGQGRSLCPGGRAATVTGTMAPHLADAAREPTGVIERQIRSQHAHRARHLGLDENGVPAASFRTAANARRRRDNGANCRQGGVQGSATWSATACRTTTAGTATVEGQRHIAHHPTPNARKTQALLVYRRDMLGQLPVNLKPVCAPPRSSCDAQQPARRSAMQVRDKRPVHQSAATAQHRTCSTQRARPANRTPMSQCTSGGLARAVNTPWHGCSTSNDCSTYSIAKYSGDSCRSTSDCRCTPTRSAMGGGATAIRVNSTVTVGRRHLAYPRRPIPVPAPPPCATCPRHVQLAHGQQVYSDHEHLLSAQYVCHPAANTASSRQYDRHLRAQPAGNRPIACVRRRRSCRQDSDAAAATYAGPLPRAR